MEYTPESAYLHRQHKWRYIPIHPFGDEIEVLQGMGLQPKDCLRTDAYWEIDGDIIFLEIIGHAHVDHDLGLYCRTRNEGGNAVFAVLENKVVTRELFENTMTSFYSSGRLFDSYPNTLTPINSEQWSAPNP